MRRVECTMQYSLVPPGHHEEGREVVTVCCGRCGHEVVVYGHSEASVRRGCAMLRDECPQGEENLYAYRVYTESYFPWPKQGGED